MKPIVAIHTRVRLSCPAACDRQFRRTDANPPVRGFPNAQGIARLQRPRVTASQPAVPIAYLEPLGGSVSAKHSQSQGAPGFSKARGQSTIADVTERAAAAGKSSHWREPMDQTTADGPARQRRKKARGGRRHGKDKARRIAKALGLPYPLNKRPDQGSQTTSQLANSTPNELPGQPGAPEAENDPEQPEAAGTAVGPETELAAPELGNPEAIANGIIETQADVRMIRKLLLSDQWVVPDAAKSFLPQDLMLIFAGKLRKGAAVTDSEEITPEVRIQAARLLAMMRQSNIAAAAQFLPSRGAVAKVRVQSSGSSSGGVNLGGMNTDVSVSIYIPDNGRDEIDRGSVVDDPLDVEATELD